jgi:stage II sporulation protein D
MTMRSRLPLAALAVLALAVVVAGRAAPPPKVDAAFLLTGGGWGHGVGLSQWGAYGQAKAGRSYREILRHYYPGTELGQLAAEVPKQVRVLVGSDLEAVAVGSGGPFRVRDRAARTYELPAGSVRVTSSLELPVGAEGRPRRLVGPLVFLPAKGANLVFAGRQYRANLRVSVVGGRLEVVNVVPLETYLRGVVPGEMPRDWPLEALKAQAVAARTYAVVGLQKGRSFDLYSDWRSQMYYGASAEAPGPTRAIAETRGEVVTYGGEPAQVFYFSSSGGRTSSALDVFGSDLPYLVSVEDPWDEASPHHRWEPRTYTGKTLARAFGLSGSVVDARIVPGAPSRPAQLVLTTAAGAATAIRLTDVRTRLGLRSSTFRLGTLRLAAPPGTVAPGSPVRLTGAARDVDRPRLEKLAPGGVWVKGPRLALAADGTFAVTLRPAATLQVRLVADGLIGIPVTIAVDEDAA